MRRFNIGWLFISLAVLAISLFYFRSMIQALLLSFQSGMGANLEYTGLDNYYRFFKYHTFKAALFNTFLYLIIQVPIMIVLALTFSVLLNDSTLKLRGFFRTAIFLPAVTSLVAYSVIFKYLFANDGIVNQVLMNLSIISEPIMWLPNPFWAQVLIIIAIDRKSVV